MLRKQCHNFRWQETLNNIVVASQNSKFGNQDPPNLADNCCTCKLTEINKFRTPYTKFTIYWCDLLYISLTLLLLFIYFTTYNWRLQKVVKLSMKLTHEIHVALRWLDLKKKKKKFIPFCITTLLQFWCDILWVVKKKLVYIKIIRGPINIYP